MFVNLCSVGRMKMYKILRTDKAEDQLRDIINYITDD